MNPPKNNGQIATMKSIKEEVGVGDSYWVYGTSSASTEYSQAFRWYNITNNRKYFTFDKSGNYPLSNNNELLCLGYVMSFSGESSSCGEFYFDGLSAETAYNIWPGNTGCTES